MKELLEKNGITLYSTENEEKSSVCGRWNRTIKTKMWKQFTVQGNTQYLDMLPKILKPYNNTKHNSIKMSPTESSKKKNEGVVYLNLYSDMETSKQKPKFKIGDEDRISKYKRKTFDKVYLFIIGDGYESDSQLDQYDLNDIFINDSQCSFDVNSDNTYETETEYSSSQYLSDSDTDFSENI